MEKLARFVAYLGIMVLVAWGFIAAGLPTLMTLAGLLIIGGIMFVMVVLRKKM